MNSGSRSIILGTRGSRLALAQARLVAAMLGDRSPRPVEIRVIETGGDRVSNWSQVRDESGIFVREIEQTLLDGGIDAAVHSVKDMPAADTPGLMLGAVPCREDPRDVLVGGAGITFAGLPPGSSVGTSSVRRAVQLLRRRPDLRIVDLRGNVETRIAKITAGAAAATVLAAAGLIRLGLERVIAEYLPLEWMLPAPCQGALGLQVRRDDGSMRALAASIDDRVAAACVAAERAFMKRLGAGCRVPVSALASSDGERLTLRGCIMGLRTRGSAEDTAHAPLAAADELGQGLAEKLLAAGGGRLMERVTA